MHYSGSEIFEVIKMYIRRKKSRPKMKIFSRVSPALFIIIYAYNDDDNKYNARDGRTVTKWSEENRFFIAKRKKKTLGNFARIVLRADCFWVKRNGHPNYITKRVPKRRSVLINRHASSYQILRQHDILVWTGRLIPISAFLTSRF